MLSLLLYIALIGIIAGLIIWALGDIIPAPIQKVIIVVAVIACILVALHAFGVHLDAPVPRVR